MARTGGAQVFFDVLATFNAKRLLQDTKTVNTMMKAAYLDTLNTLTGEFQALGQMITEFTDEVIASSRAFEEARIDFEKFVNVSEEMETILPSMVEDVVKIGEGFAFTGEEALKAASRMAQMGAVIGQSTIGVGTEIGVMFGLISGMETDAAMRRLTNLMQQTGFHMANNLEKTTKLTTAQFNMLSAIEKENMFRENSIDVLNQLNTVENRSIATMEQLTYTMNQFASQASLTGSSIAEMAAMSATLIEAGEQQGAAGRALRMMYARLGGDIAGAREEMEAMGIEVLDQEGNMKTLHQIMVDLNEKGFHLSN
jgi:TP901 family phage tail tape measure protein